MRPPASLVATLTDILKVAATASSLPGGLVLVSYAVSNRFFPYLIATLHVSGLVFISAVVFAIFVFATVMGVAVTFWFVWLLVRLRAVKRHIFMPPDRFTRLLWVVVSFGAFITLLSAALFQALKGSSQTLSLVLYFAVSGFLIATMFAPADGNIQEARRLLPLALSAPFLAMLMLLGTVQAQLDLYMALMGFRSQPGEQIYLDASGYARLVAQLAPLTPDLPICHPQSASPMWHLPHGVVVWDAADDHILLSTGTPGERPLLFERRQVTIQPPGSPACADADRNPRHA